MQANDAPFDSGVSPARRRALFVAGLAAALLGLTLLDVAPLEVPQRQAEGIEPTDCIVASAVFAGVSTALP